MKAVTSMSVMSISASPQPQEGLCPFSGQETEAPKPPHRSWTCARGSLSPWASQGQHLGQQPGCSGLGGGGGLRACWVFRPEPVHTSWTISPLVYKTRVVPTAQVIRRVSPRHGPCQTRCSPSLSCGLIWGHGHPLEDHGPDAGWPDRAQPPRGGHSPWVADLKDPYSSGTTAGVWQEMELTRSR